MARDLLDLVWMVPLLPLTGAVVLLLVGQAHRRAEGRVDRHHD